jgi:hypothetical protein
MDFSLFENKHQGERCFILGNAPSLKEEDLSLLKNETIFICNKGYLITKMLNLYRYDYYFCTDQHVYIDNHENIKKLVKCPKFYSSKIFKKETRKLITEDYVLIDKSKNLPRLGHDVMPVKFQDTWGLTGSVVLEASMVAFFMGFKEIYLLGVDLNYQNENTHFYPMGEREKKYKNHINNNIENIKKTISGMDNFFKKNQIKFCNLSSGFKLSHIMETSTLKNIIC